MPAAAAPPRRSACLRVQSAMTPPRLLARAAAGSPAAALTWHPRLARRIQAHLSLCLPEGSSIPPVYRLLVLPEAAEVRTHAENTTAGAWGALGDCSPGLAPHVRRPH